MMILLFIEKLLLKFFNLFLHFYFMKYKQPKLTLKGSLILAMVALRASSTRESFKL